MLELTEDGRSLVVMSNAVYVHDTRSNAVVSTFQTNPLFQTLCRIYITLDKDGWGSDRGFF